MRYLPKLPDDSYAKTETLKILKQHKAYMAQFEEMLNDEKIRITTGTCKPSMSHQPQVQGGKLPRPCA